MQMAILVCIQSTEKMKPLLKNKTGSQALGTEKILKLVTQFSVTTLAALILNSVYTLTDALFVSWGMRG